MISPAKLDANRRNAQLSTGPKTEEGKAKSSANALKHGLTAQTFTLLPGEDPALYETYIDETLAAYHRRTALETALVTRLAQILWQLGRLPAALTQLFEAKMKEHPGSTPEQILALAFCDGTKPNAFERLQRYEATLDRAFSKTLQHLRQLQSENEPTEAAPSPVQKEPKTAPRTPPPPAVQKEPTAPPITLPAIPSTPVHKEPKPIPHTPAPHTMQKEATQPGLTPSQRQLLYAATSQLDFAVPRRTVQASPAAADLRPLTSDF